MQMQAGSPHGFSLVEMVTGIAITAILAGVAVPSLREVAHGMQLSAYAQQFLSELNLARSEAIKRNSRVVVCKSSDGETCATTRGWEQGWIVFHDVNNNAARDVAEPVLRRGEGVLTPYRILGNETVSRYLSFSPFGGTRLTSGAFQAGTITLCRESLEPSQARQLVINAVGRPRIQKVSLESCT